jgi:hypothetical protein
LILIPEIRRKHISREGANAVRAQAIHLNGFLLMDFAPEQKPGHIHHLNTPFPAATASLAIASRRLAQKPKTAAKAQTSGDSKKFTLLHLVRQLSVIIDSFTAVKINQKFIKNNILLLFII